MDGYTKTRNPGYMPVTDMPTEPGPVIRPDVPAVPLPPLAGEKIDSYPIAMAYVPWQTWQQVYPIDRALNRGTLFPELDQPFTKGRCQ